MKKLIAITLSMVLLIAVLCPSVFAAEGDPYVAENDQGEKFTSLTQAVNETYETWEEGIITLLAETTLDDNLTIPDTIEIVIPSGSDGESLTTGNNVPGGQNVGEPNRILHISAGKVLTVYGRIIVAGNQQSTQPFSGLLTGNYGEIDLNGSIVIENGGELYARGKIDGSGEITAKSGSSVYQRFQIYDWRGGTQTLESVGLQVFPFSLFDIGGISVKTTYVNGAKLYAQAYIYAGGEGRTQDIPYLGSDDGLVRFDQATGDGVVFEKNGDNTTITAKTAVSTASLSIDVQTTDIFGNETTTTISTEKLICPFGFRMNLVVDNGASLSVFNRYKLVPGFKLTVNEGGTLNINSGAEMYFYAAGGYKEDYSFDPRNELEWDYSAAAVLESSGEINLNGDLATTSQDMTNLPAGQFQLVTGGLPTYVGEYIQGTHVGHVELVRFYKVTPATAE